MRKMIIDQEYNKLFLELKTRVTASRYRSAVKVNNELINLYHHIGNIILQSQEKEGWGAKIINQLSMDLRAEFPDMKGFSPQNIKYMRKFAEEFSQTAIGQQAVDQIPWGHIVLLMYSGLDKEQTNFYVNQTVESGWSRNVLSMQIETKLHKRKGAAVTNFDKKLPLPQSDLAQSTLKNPYLFDFFRESFDKADTFMIDPAADNPRAKRVYEKAGFKQVADFIMGGNVSGSSEIGLDDDTWLRSRAWVLWKATFELCNIADKNSPAARLQKKIIDEVINE
ncbi:MAG TPA: DUF1016 N-terminal domain-containing protein [Candidatus Megaira endosymbiont of Nemacystus decipiens]|nr:DUF1016 N-terminal domain-containing protein [Candidatus Megaera endosymbiont of Nemacystus decipiens]